MPETEELEIVEPEVVADSDLSFGDADVDFSALDVDSMGDLGLSNADFVVQSASTSSLVFSGVLTVWSVVCMWLMFNKAGLPGWGAIIPFYNLYLWFRLAGRSGWWLLSILFPPLLLIIIIITYFDIAKRFGKSAWFGVGLLFLNPIFEGILAFDNSEYHKK